MIASGIAASRRCELRYHGIHHDSRTCLTILREFIAELWNHTRLGYDIDDGTGTCATGKTSEDINIGAGGFADCIDTFELCHQTLFVLIDIGAEKDSAGTSLLGGCGSDFTQGLAHHLGISNNTLQTRIAAGIGQYGIQVDTLDIDKLTFRELCIHAQNLPGLIVGLHHFDA